MPSIMPVQSSVVAGKWRAAGAAVIVFILAAAAVATAQTQPPPADREPQLTVEQRQVHEAEAQRLWEEAQHLHKEGKIKESVAARLQMLSVVRRLSGRFHEDVALVLDVLALQYEDQKEFAAAKSAREESLDIKTRVLGKNHWQVTEARVALQYVDILRGLSEEGRRALEDAALLSAKVLNLKDKGEFAQALPLAIQVVATRKQFLGEQHVAYGASLHDLGRLYYRIGDSARAESLFRQVLGIWEGAYGEQHPAIAAVLKDLARQFHSTGDNTRAERFFRQALQILQGTLGEQHARYAETLDDLSLLYHSLGDYAQAEPICRRALEIRKKAMGEQHPDYAGSLNNLAGLYQSMGDNQRAEPLYRQALDISKKALGDTHPNNAAILNNLAGLYYSMNECARAETLLREASEIWMKAVGESHPAYAISLNNLAEQYSAMGDYAQAERLFRQALEITRKALGDTHPDFALILHNLAFVYELMGEYARAEPLYRQAMEIDRNALREQHPGYATCLNNLAGLYHSMGDNARAESFYRRALVISRQNLNVAAVVQSERQQLAMRAAVRHQLHGLISLAATTPQYGSVAFDEVLAWKGLVLSRQRAMRSVADRPELAPIWEELRTTATKLATLSLATPTPTQAANWQANIAELSSQKEMLESRLAAASSEYRAALKPINAANLRASLPEYAALVDFLEFGQTETKPKEQGGGRLWERHLAAFIVRREGEVRLVDLGQVQPLAEAIEAWRSGLGGTAESKQAAQLLRDKLWLPLEQHLAGATTVLISPDGDLGKLPFAALPGKQPGSYLAEERLIAVVPSAAALPALVDSNPQRSAEKTLLVVGGVEYGRAETSPVEVTVARISGHAPREAATVAWKPLPETKGELATVKLLYDEAERFTSRPLTLLQKSTATEEAFRREAPQHKYLHLATHGFFAAAKFKSALDRSTADNKRLGPERLLSEQSVSGYHPNLLSGIVLAGANQPPEGGDDGILTAEEVQTLDLRGTELVVLSACETGLGKSAGGEGLLGLQRAFQVAGAQTVIASLWKVDDAATRGLMERFYDNLWTKNMGKLEALREAQLWMLRKRGPRGLKPVETDAGTAEASNRLPPYYWAAFVLSGDWR